MISIAENNDTLYTVAREKLIMTDYNSLTPALENMLHKYPKINWYFEMQDFKGWKVDSFWQDLKLDVKHANDFKKIAMVGDKEWQELLTKVMKPFTSAEVKFFDLSHKEEAREWIET